MTMRTQFTLRLIAATLTAVVLCATPAAGQPMIVTNLTGDLHVQQEIPCVDDVDLTTPVTGGRIELSPAAGFDVPGGKLFMLTRADVTFEGFSVHRSCLTIDRTRTYNAIGVQLARAVSFTAVAVGPGVFAVTIPKDDFIFYESSIVNGSHESGYKTAGEDVTGTIDLVTRTVQLQAVVTQTVHFEAGCTPLGCVVNGDGDGVLTATISGNIVLPDSDGDGVPDLDDNCRLTPNPDQAPVPTPVITAPADFTIASCADHQIGAAAATDVCDAGPVTVTNDAPATFAIGANTVTWTAADAISRTATDAQIVTVVDATAPAFTSVPLDLTLNNCVAADIGRPTATDDCAGAVSFTNDAPPIFPVGPTVVTWTATDVSGNDTTATQTVTVTDTVPPTVACVPDGPPGHTFRVVAIDACTSAPLVFLGSFTLAHGERIKITETGQSGVRLVNVIGDIKHFHVGKGEGVITASDGSANVASAACDRKHDTQFRWLVGIQVTTLATVVGALLSR
jgi:hypothetical protein